MHSDESGKMALNRGMKKIKMAESGNEEAKQLSDFNFELYKHKDEFKPSISEPSHG